jgi:hypothetical protein
MTARQAAEAANQMRNEIMDMARARSTDLGRAKAQALKSKGIAFEKLLEKYAQQKFGRPFNSLGKQQQNTVLLEVVDSAIAVYNVATANNKVDAAAREGVTIAGGFAGGAAGGALAGIWFGPVGVAVGVAIGGVVGSLVADELYVELVPVGTESVASLVDAHTRPFSTDEDGLARALYERGGIDANFVKAVFAVLADRYATDADDVALAYVNIVKTRGGSQLHALKLDTSLKHLLIQLMEQGWTSSEESAALRYLRTL